MKKIKDTREKMYRFRANEEESELIEKKYRLSAYSSLSDFFRQMILYGIVVKYDEEKFEKLFTRILNLIENMASNVNQITTRVNSTNRVYAEDLKQIEKRLNEVWQLQKFIQSQLQNPKL